MCGTCPAVRPRGVQALTWITTAAMAAIFSMPAQAVNFPVIPEWRETARKVAQDGVPLSELAPNAPDSYTVKRGDTLWAISGIFLRRPWRWPELWGMNLEQIRNPHLIFPGQVLYLDKSGGRARLRLGRPVGDVKLSPQVRSTPLEDGAIASIDFRLIEPFLNEAVVFETDALEAAPRIVATQEGRVLLTRGDLAYVRGPVDRNTSYRIFREPQPMRDPATGEVLGFEAQYVGAADFVRSGEARPGADPATLVPTTFRLASVRQEANVGDRLAPPLPRDFSNYAPRAPENPVSGQIVSIYGDALTAGQNQIVALNRGAREGLQRGHVLALWRAGETTVDRTDPRRPVMKLPDERHGLLFVFQVFKRVSYALILQVQEPVRPGDRFSEP
ncbi:LysM peptidoglycan-binding domain-containing protein [Piscinibacter sakaiensis]|uniref:LysM peptidoglycan-binding domain-containing protein n=1 Tax=Piscinibacter sakaiensis TaxID=1547922 RepID=UPI003AAFD80F